MYICSRRNRNSFEGSRRAYALKRIRRYHLPGEYNKRRNRKENTAICHSIAVQYKKKVFARTTGRKSQRARLFFYIARASANILIKAHRENGGKKCECFISSLKSFKKVMTYVSAKERNRSGSWVCARVKSAALFMVHRSKV